MSACTFICRYCFERKPNEERSEEHVVPAALGGGLTIRDICKSCQTDADQQVDRPFVRSITIREARHHYGVPDRYGAVPPPVRMRGRVVQDGSAALVTLNRVDPQFRWLPVEEWHDERTLTFGAEASEFEAYKKQKFERLATRHSDVEDLGEELRVIEQPEITCDHASDPQLKVPVNLWARFAAKVALALAPEALGDAWIGSPPAVYLQTVMRGFRPSPPEGFQPLRCWPDALWDSDGARYYRPPEHVLMMNQIDRAAILRLVLFGEQTYGVPLGNVRLPNNPPTWVFDPVGRCYERLPKSLWLACVAERFDDPRPPYHAPPLSVAA